jgi:hypothetical protein
MRRHSTAKNKTSAASPVDPSQASPNSARASERADDHERQGDA